MFRFLGHRSDESALILLEKDGRERISNWNDYQDKALAAASALYQNGVRNGDFVAVIALNLPESFIVMLGIILLGAVPVPINVPLIKELGQKDLKFILNDCRPKLVLANGCLAKYLPDIEHRVLEIFLEPKYSRLDNPKSSWQNNELLIMPYTSGTTGGPKGAMLSTGNITDRVDAIVRELSVSSSERVLSYLSLGHISELVATFLGQLQAGYRVYFTEHIKDIVENREKFRAAFPSVLQKVQPTVFLAVPKVWTNFRKEIERKTRFIPFNLSRRGLIHDHIVKKIKQRLGFEKTRCFVSAGSLFSQEDANFFAKLEIDIDDIYGQTETGGPLTINGKVVGNTSVLLGKDGEILVKGPNVMLGYFNRPEATAEVLKEGVYHTGDTGIVLCGGRLGDGYKNAQTEFVSPEKIEEREESIRKIEGVDEAIVCGEGKPYDVALVFSSNPSEKLRRKLKVEITKIGQGMYRVRKFLLVNSRELELTPTLKVKRKKMLQKFQKEIDEL